jgi:hypothetical protein
MCYSAITPANTDTIISAAQLEAGDLAGAFKTSNNLVVQIKKTGFEKSYALDTAAIKITLLI